MQKRVLIITFKATFLSYSSIGLCSSQISVLCLWGRLQEWVVPTVETLVLIRLITVEIEYYK